MQLKRKEMLTSVVDDMRTQKMYTEINKDFFFWGGGVSFVNCQSSQTKLLTEDQSSGIHIGLAKVLQLLKKNHGNYFVKLA